MEIHADIDSYGQYARISYLADLVEIHVLGTAQPLWLSRVREALRDSDYTKSVCGLMSDTDLLDDERNEPAGDWLVEELRARAVFLGAHYPFDVTHDQILPHNKIATRYTELLLLTIIHAHPEVLSPNATVKPTSDFEEIVSCFLSECLNGRVVRSGVSRGKFEALMNQLRSVGFPAGSISVSRSRAANDDGVDSVAWCWDFDSRGSVATIIVQSTITTSDKWEKKASEPSEYRWRMHLGLIARPRAALAVPHVIPSEMISRLSESSQNPILIDRIQLSKVAHLSTGGVYHSMIAGLSVDLFS